MAEATEATTYLLRMKAGQWVKEVGLVILFPQPKASQSKIWAQKLGMGDWTSLLGLEIWPTSMEER